MCSHLFPYGFPLLVAPPLKKKSIYKLRVNCTLQSVPIVEPRTWCLTRSAQRVLPLSVVQLTQCVQASKEAQLSSSPVQRRNGKWALGRKR